MRDANAPYEPVYFPAMGEPWRGRLARFLRYCESLTIESKELGATALIVNRAQRLLIESIFAGLGEDVHDFVVLKRRQMGASTILWALDLWWLTTFSGILGMYITDSEGNKDIHRRKISAMYQSLPGRLTRGPWSVNNRLELRWNSVRDRATGRTRWAASHLLWDFVNKKDEGRLGISKGVNFIHGTEIDTWDDDVGSLAASTAKLHPLRLYVWEGTGRGYGPLYTMWGQAQSAVASRAIFLGFWMGEEALTRDQAALWAAYGAPPPTQEELEWGAEVKRRYDYTVARGQLAWWRWQLAEGKDINGDQAAMLEQYPWLPEQAFQPKGSAFISRATVMRMRGHVSRGGSPSSYRYDWGTYFDSRGDEALIVVPEEAATLTIWEPPQPGMIYVLGADPAYGSSEKADRYAATLWKCFPDAMEQVAEYVTPLGAMYEFAWVLMHLLGSYRIDEDAYWICDVNGPGRAVDEELQRMANYGFGLSPQGRREGAEVQQVIGAIRRYLYRRVDTIQGQSAWHFNTTVEARIQIFEQLRDNVERGTLIIRSERLSEEVAALRRTPGGRIEAGGVAHDDLAFSTALAVHCWLENVIPEIDAVIAPQDPGPGGPRHVGEGMLRGFLSGLRHAEGDEKSRPIYGVRTPAPGR